MLMLFILSLANLLLAENLNRCEQNLSEDAYVRVVYEELMNDYDDRSLSWTILNRLSPYLLYEVQQLDQKSQSIGPIDNPKTLPYFIKVSMSDQRQNFEIMSSVVTNAVLKGWSNFLSVKMDREIDQSKPTHPATFVSFEDVKNIIRKVNHLAATNPDLLREIIPDHPDYSFYRLPFSFEYEHLAKTYFSDGELLNLDRVRSSEVLNYGDSVKLSDGPSASASRNGIAIQGSDFLLYDILGNTIELTEGSVTLFYNLQAHLSGELPGPFVGETGAQVLGFGRSYQSKFHEELIRWDVRIPREYKSHENSFRLVRVNDASERYMRTLVLGAD